MINLNEFDVPTAIIRLNDEFYTSSISPDELYDITRCYWKSSRRKVLQCERVLAVYHGVVVEVYQVDDWVDGSRIVKKTHLNAYRAGSYGFNGKIAEASVRNQFVGRGVKHLFKCGDRAPVRVFGV